MVFAGARTPPAARTAFSFSSSTNSIPASYNGSRGWLLYPHAHTHRATLPRTPPTSRAPWITRPTRTNAVAVILSSAPDAVTPPSISPTLNGPCARTRGHTHTPSRARTRPRLPRAEPDAFTARTQARTASRTRHGFIAQQPAAGGSLRVYRPAGHVPRRRRQPKFSRRRRRTPDGEPERRRGCVAGARGEPAGGRGRGGRL